jgi:ubiquinone biosynthesis protein
MALLMRGIWILLAFAGALLAYAARRLRRPGLSARAAQRLRGDVLAELLARLGATYVKFGQILSSRPDLLGPGYIEALARLQDSVQPAPFAHIRAVLEAELGPHYAQQLVHVEAEPIAAASVAHVHRARLADGREVALKVQRPLARNQIERDLSLLGFGARLLDRIPALRMLSLPGGIASFGTALRGQLDFRQEAENNRRFARNFADSPDVRVPGLIPELCTERVLAMEFVTGVKASQPERVGGDRKRLSRVGADTVLKMIFRDGFVHADLHPGNVLLTDDGKIVLIDLGMVATIPSEMIRPWVETNVALAQQDGRGAARLFYGYAPTVSTRDYARYEDEVDAYFRGYYGKSFGEVEVTEVVSGIFNILRRHGVQIDPVFTVVNVSMLVAEGLGKQLDPDLDMVELSKPYLFDAMMRAPAGKAPLRSVPVSQSLSALGV